MTDSILPKIVSAEKALVQAPNWSPPEPETGHIWFNAPLDIGGATEAGLFLHGGCTVNLPDRAVVFELVLTGYKGRRRTPLERVCWRSLQGGHSNRRGRNAPLSGKRVGDTHLHAFGDNFSAVHDRMMGGNLPQADGISEILDTYESLREYVGKRFKINNIGIVPVPPWSYTLF